ncbi:MAG TPA: VOC family protein, partial [Ktedonobacterales bacterium]
MALTLTHIWLLVEDMPRALGFYRDTLGLGIASDLGDFVELNANEHVLLSLFTRAAMGKGE